MYKDFFYFDIETTSKYGDINTLKLNDPRGYELFLKKCEVFKDEWKEPIEQLYPMKAPLMSEHGMIVCISYGIFKNGVLQIGSFLNRDGNEEELMNKIKKLFDSVGNKKRICGYNIKNFDIPWITRKLYKYNLEIPNNIYTVDKKPWETWNLDIFDIWKSSGKIQRVNPSMDEVAYDLGIESSKANMNGSQVHDYYWVKKDYDSIMHYCELDVKVLVEITKRMML
jgi:3'-5' exonuclease